HDQRVFVTLERDLGASGSRPFASDSNAAQIWAGTINGIGVSISSTSFARNIERDEAESISLSLVIERESACNSLSRPRRSILLFFVTPVGANRMTGNRRSTTASGPWKKSAD